MTQYEKRLVELLSAILDTLNTIPNARVPERFRGTTRFKDTYEIAAAIRPAIDWTNV